MRFSLLALLIIASGCTSKKTSSTTYFGGEIINPNDSYVFLYKNEEIIDSVELNDENRFLIKLDENLEEGLYYFVHKPEQQYVFIEKGDSVLIRLNTLHFDESLVFTGEGAEKNNFLIDMYLMHEDEENLVNYYFSLEPKEFNHKMDSLRAMKFDQYNDLISMFEISENAKNVASASIEYPYYDTKEIYPYMNKKTNKFEEITKIPVDFYKYRENINLNDSRLSYYKPYLDYLVMHLSNISYQECKNDCKDKNISVERSLHFHTHKLKLIDSIIENNDLRDNLFRNTAYTYLLRDHDAKANQEFILAFNRYSKNNRYLDEINKLYTSIQNLQQGNMIPSVHLVKSDGSITSSDSIVKENTVYYFWSMNQKAHMKKINNRVNELQKKYPSYHFAGININEDHGEWVKMISKLELDEKKQFRCANFNETSRKFVINGLNKVMIIKSDGTIVNAFSNIYEPYFEEALKNL